MNTIRHWGVKCGWGGLFFALATQAFAIEALNDEALSGVTGQDGITVTITPPGPYNMDIIWHDKDGLTGVPNQTYGSAGALILGTANGLSGNPFTITSGSSNVNIIVKLDADGGTNGAAPTMNANISLPGLINFYTGDIWVAKSNATSKTQSARGFTNPVKVLDNMSYQLENISLNLQFANQPQGSMIKLGWQMTNGLKIDNVNVYDNSAPIGSRGGIGVKRILLTNTQLNSFGDPTFSFNGSAKVSSKGLEIAVESLGDAGGLDVLATQVSLGNLASVSSSIGDVEIAGLHANGSVITISGH